MRHRRRITVVLALACATAAPPAHAHNEAPMLAPLVADGRLPPVNERLPEAPVVVEPVREIGKYGGQWRRIAIGPYDILLTGRMGYESLVQWDRAGRKTVPGIAERYEIKDGGRTYVFHLRKGMRWSDGHPFTSETFQYYYEDVLGNQDLTPVFPDWLTVGGKPVVIKALDPYTVEFRFAKPYGIFLEMLSFRGMEFLQPKHYLKQFHPKYADPASLAGMIKEAGLDHWFQLYPRKAMLDENPDLPSVKPWTVKVPLPATRVIAERNPYYWKVDPDGNQLPYIDRVVYAVVQNPEIVNFKAMTGDVDFQARFIDSTNYSLFMANRKQGRYRVLVDPQPASIVMYVNPYSKDERLRPILADRRFRIALSLAIDRDELIDLLFSGLAEKSRGVASSFDAYWLPEFERYLDHDPQRAAALLDEVGLKKGPGGMRCMPDGTPFCQIINCYPAETGVGMDLWQLVADYFRDVGLEFVVKMDARTLSSMQVRNGNTNFWAYGTAGMHWVVNPEWYVPWSSASYFAPLYGRYHASMGKRGIQPPPEYQHLIDWYLELRSVVDDQPRKLALGRKILEQWSRECYTIGVIRRKVLTIVSDRFKNVPDQIIQSNRLQTPGYIGIEQFYIDQE
ncbi:MAG: ABC transporter substrate-binding protein [Phycisphaerae bacterium]|nr:ABC transporter substrate-binding protein [Phycisphaerae bacterium]